MRTFVKDMVPPILARNLLAALRRWGFQVGRCQPPEWVSITDGPAKGSALYVTTEQPAFHEMMAGTYDSPIWERLRGVPTSGTTAIDIGAHIGYHSLCFAALCGEAGITVAIEPNPFNLERLRMIVERNATLAGHIRVLELALSDCGGIQEFHFSRFVDDQTSSGGYLAGAYVPLPAEVYQEAGFISKTVHVSTLDQIVEDEHLENVSVVKVDVEGAEHLVLQGGQETIRRDRPILFIEVHSVKGMLEVSKVLQKLAYQSEVIQEFDASRCVLVARPE